MKKQPMEGRETDKQTQSRTRGALESDCAVVPVSAVFHHHPYTGGVRQNVGFSEGDSSVEMKDIEPTNSTIVYASTDFQLRQHSTQNRSGVGPLTAGFQPITTGEYRPIRPSDLSAWPVESETKELEAEVVRLHMEDEEDELCENCDTALHAAVKKRTNVEEIKSLAEAAAAAGQLDELNYRWQTALHLAVITNRPDVVSLLVSLGSALTVQEQRFGDNVLHLACRLGHGRCLDAVIDAWMKRAVNKQSSKNQIETMLHSINFEGETCLHLAAKLDDKGIFYFLVYSFDADINITEAKRGQTVLHEAADRKDLDIVNFVLSCKSRDINLQTGDHWTALDMAIGRHWNEGQEVLVSAGGQTTLNVHVDELSDSDMDWCSMQSPHRIIYTQSHSHLTSATVPPLVVFRTAVRGGWKCRPIHSVAAVYPQLFVPIEENVLDYSWL